MAGNVLSMTKRLDHGEHLDRLRAYHAGLPYAAFLKRRAELRDQAEILRRRERAREKTAS